MSRSTAERRGCRHSKILPAEIQEESMSMCSLEKILHNHGNLSAVEINLERAIKFKEMKPLAAQPQTWNKYVHPPTTKTSKLTSCVPT